MGLTGDWGKARRLFKASGIDGIIKQAVGQTAAFFEGKIKTNIVSGGKEAGAPFDPNSPLTIKIKGSSEPLINTGDMLGSVKAHVINSSTGFIGLRRGETHKDGGQVADIAAVHEFGALVSNHEVPARPFIGPVLKKNKKGSGKIFLDAIEKGINNV